MDAMRRRPLLGVGLIMLAASLFATLDTINRLLGASLPILLMLWSRYTFQAVAVGLWLTRSGRPAFRSAHPRFQFARGALLLATSALSFYGVQLMPVAEFTAINMVTPVIVTLLAAWLLKEPVTRLRWALVAGGFAGVLVVIRPGSGLIGWVAVFPLAGALTYASFQVLTSKLASSESPFTTLFYTGAVGSLVLTPILFLSPIDVAATLLAAPPQALWLLLAIGVVGTLGHWLLVLAFGMAPASTLMPFMYTQIAAAALGGWLVFRQLPDAWAWLGMAVIAVCGALSLIHI